jgi:hypothetical protein
MVKKIIPFQCDTAATAYASPVEAIKVTLNEFSGKNI